MKSHVWSQPSGVQYCVFGYSVHFIDKLFVNEMNTVTNIFVNIFSETIT